MVWRPARRWGTNFLRIGGESIRGTVNVGATVPRARPGGFTASQTVRTETSWA